MYTWTAVALNDCEYSILEELVCAVTLSPLDRQLRMLLTMRLIRSYGAEPVHGESPYAQGTTK